ALHSFPTRRSSDLVECGTILGELASENMANLFTGVCIVTYGQTDQKKRWNLLTIHLTNILNRAFPPIPQDLYYSIIYKEGLRKAMYVNTYVLIQLLAG